MSQAIMGIVSDLVRADLLVKRLFRCGFCDGSVSVFRPDSPLSHIRCEKHNRACEYALLGATAGGAIVGLICLLSNATFLRSPTLSSLFAYDHVTALLCGIGLGGMAGVTLGTLLGLFIPKYEIKQFAGFFSGGNVLVSVHIEAKGQSSMVKELFEAAQAQDIHCIEEQDLE